MLEAIAGRRNSGSKYSLTDRVLFINLIYCTILYNYCTDTAKFNEKSQKNIDLAGQNTGRL
jgi:hypothetical protein